MAELCSQHCEQSDGDPRHGLMFSLTGLWTISRLFVIAPLLSFSLAAQLSAAPGDFDNDAIPDEIDADSDNDGLPNIQEGLVDTDNDGWPDYLDLDSDNDTIPDLLETILDRSIVNAIDADQNGQIDAGIDLGGNGFANQLELEVDSGSINFQIPDADADGIPNLRDLDSDNDGLSDRLEYRNDSSFQFAQIDNIADGNQNGIDDTLLLITEFFDADGDGFENAFDLDSDNDGLSDLLETAGTGFQGSPLQFIDTDNDGFANQLDLDSDNDGLTDADEIGGAAAPTVTTDDSPAPTADGSTDNDATSPEEAGPTIITTGVDGSVGGCSIFVSAGSGTATNAGGALQWLLMLLLCASPKLIKSFSRQRSSLRS